MRAAHQAVPRVLTIAGSDSGGGAGIQADLKTFTSQGVYGASVITALTAQNTLGVQGVHIPPTSCVRQQLESVFTDIGFSVVKTGMLPNADIMKETARAIRQFNVTTVIADPVLVATSGDALVSGEDSLKTLVAEILPLATLLTPNIPEASRLTGKSVLSVSDMRRACIDLVAMGCKNVLLKGGHLSDEGRARGITYTDDIDPSVATDILYDGLAFQAFTKPRVMSRNTHGTGCTLASAIAAELAKGNSLFAAVKTAKEFVYHGILEGLDIGKGHGPLNHMNSFVREAKNV